MIELANLNDIPNIMSVINEVVAEMKTYNNTQWDSNYPNTKTFENDIENGNLYVYRKNNDILGFVCLDFNEPNEYNDIKWRSTNKALVLHRMAVANNARKKGIGLELIAFAKELAANKGVNYMKTDTYSINDKMNGLFKKVGFIKVGEMNFLNREFIFYVYDLVI